MEKKQSSVEWYIENRKKLEYDYDTKGIGILKFIERKNEIEKQAKAMHKKEIEDAVNFGDEHGQITTYLTVEKYYNETFGGDNE